MKIGCPCISMVRGEDGKKKAAVDPLMCVGCGLCKELCAFGAFED